MSGRKRAVSDPFWATAIDRMDPGVVGIVRGLYGIVQRSPALRPYIWFGSGWRTGSKEHSSGCAIDVMFVSDTGKRPNKHERAAAKLFSDWVIRVGDELGAQWILYSFDGKNRTQSYNFDRGTVNNLKDRGSVSANHVDHAHIYFKPLAAWNRAYDTVVIGERDWFDMATEKQLENVVTKATRAALERFDWEPVYDEKKYGKNKWPRIVYTSRKNNIMRMHNEMATIRAENKRIEEKLDTIIKTLSTY